MANKLELTWLGKENVEVIEPRLLIENSSLSNCKDLEETRNMLIHGDNLLALKALIPQFSGKIKCIYIDPPYNTSNLFEEYDDNVEHSIWLSKMRQRLVLLRELLTDDGCIFVQINDDEGAYLKVLCDEVFGRSNYETTFYVKVRHDNRILREDSRYQLVIEQVHMYRKTSAFIAPRREKTKNADDDYKWEVEIIGDKTETIHIGSYDVEIYKPEAYKIRKVADGDGHFKQYQIRGSLITQHGSASEYYEQNLRSRRQMDGLGCLYKVIGMGVNGDGLGYRYIMQPEKANSKNGFYFQGLPIKKKEGKGLPWPNFYDKTDIFNNAGYEGYGRFSGGKKPEAWIDFLLMLGGVKQGDIVLDSFLGSGTTAAVCLKRGYAFIGVELGDHAYTQCKPRLDSIISNEDEFGIDYLKMEPKGYRFFELAPTLIKEDDFGQAIINKEYNSDMLAAAVAIHEGFKFEPDSSCYWKQSRNDNNTFLYVTTNHVNEILINSIKAELKDDEYLIIVCKSYDESIKRAYKNITIKKIPQSLLNNCTFDVDDYNLNIVCPPVYDDEEED